MLAIRFNYKPFCSSSLPQKIEKSFCIKNIYIYYAPHFSPKPKPTWKEKCEKIQKLFLVTRENGWQWQFCGQLESFSYLLGNANCKSGWQSKPIRGSFLSQVKREGKVRLGIALASCLWTELISHANREMLSPNPWIPRPANDTRVKVELFRLTGRNWSRGSCSAWAFGIGENWLD